MMFLSASTFILLRPKARESENEHLLQQCLCANPDKNSQAHRAVVSLEFASFPPEVVNIPVLSAVSAYLVKPNVPALSDNSRHAI